MAHAAHAVRRRWTNGADELSHAIGGLHAVFLSLHDWTFRTRRPGARFDPDGGAVWIASRIEQLVARAIPLRPDGVVVARNDLWKIPVDAEGRACRVTDP